MTFGVVVKVLAQDADVGDDACDCRDEQVAFEVGLAHEQTFGPGSDAQFVAHIEFVEQGSEVAVRGRDQLDE